MTSGETAPRRCLLCGGPQLAPVLYPPLVRCRDCGVVFRDVPAERAEIREGFEASYENAGRERIIQARRTRLYDACLAGHRPVPGRDRLLDVGCGAGEFLERARRQGWQVFGVEIAEAGAEAARAAGLPVARGPLTRVDLPAESFDLVTFWNVLDFVRDPVADLRAARRLLTPGGRVVLRVTNLRFHAPLFWTSRLLAAAPRLAALAREQCFFGQVSFSARTLRTALRSAGFDRITVANAAPSDGDPYHTLPRLRERWVHAAKQALYLGSEALAACSGRRLLLASSLWAAARRPPAGTASLAQAETG